MLSEYDIHLVHSSKAHFSGCSGLDSSFVLIECCSRMMHFPQLRRRAFLNLSPFSKEEKNCLCDFIHCQFKQILLNEDLMHFKITHSKNCMQLIKLAKIVEFSSVCRNER